MGENIFYEINDRGSQRFLYSCPFRQFYRIRDTNFSPLTNYPVSIGSIFIIDPLYTIPLLLGLIFCFFSKDQDRSLKANYLALGVSTIYLFWTLGMQFYVGNLAKVFLKEKTLIQERVLTIPTPFNSILWRIVAIGEDGYYVGYYSLLDKSKEIKFKKISSSYYMTDKLMESESTRNLKRFTHGFWSVDEIDNRWVISDIRMGVEDLMFSSFLLPTKKGMRFPMRSMRSSRTSLGLEDISKESQMRRPSYEKRK